MTAQTRFNRPPKYERFTRPDASAAETVIHYLLAPYDDAVNAMNIKWGYDRLPGLVGEAMAQKYGRAVAALNSAIRGDDPEAVRQNAENCVKALATFDSMAMQAGAALADPLAWEFEVDGVAFTILRDARQWPAYRAAHPDKRVLTAQEIANAIAAYDMTVANVQHTPDAAPVKARPKKDADLDDEIPWL